MQSAILSARKLTTRLCTAVVVCGIAVLAAQAWNRPAEAQTAQPDKDKKELKSDAKDVPTDCVQLANMYRTNLSTATGRQMSPQAAVLESTTRHMTQQRLLWISWAMRCDMRPIIDAETRYHLGTR
jgi:cell division protein FtsL